MAKKVKAEVRPIVLVVTQDGETREYEFKQDSVIIGSGPTANVVLDDDTVSSIHAIIKLTMETATLIDLGSENGTFVNGNETREQKLKDGDKVKLGDIELDVQLPAVTASAAVSGAVETKPDASPSGRPAKAEDKTVNLTKPVTAAKAPPAPSDASNPNLLAPESTTAEQAEAVTAQMTTPNFKPAIDAKTIEMDPVNLPADVKAALKGEAKAKPEAKPAPKAEAKPEAKAAKQDKKAAKAPVVKEDEREQTEVIRREPAAAEGLHDLNGKLTGVDVTATGIAKAVVAHELPPTERATKDAKTLQVALHWGDQLLQVRHFETPQDITIGEDSKNTFSIAADGLPESMTFVRVEADGLTVVVPDAFATEVALGKELFDRDGLKSRGRLKPTDGAVKSSAFKLGLNERIAVKIGAVTLSVQYVTPAQKFRSSLIQRLDQAFVGVAVFTSLFFLFVFAMVLVSPKGEESAEDDLFKNQARFAKLMLKDEQKKPQKKFELSGSKGGGKHKDDEGKFGKKEAKQKDALASAKGAPKVDPNKREKDRKIALNAGILGALKGGKAEAVSNVFGPGGLGTGINSAMGGLRGTAMGDAGGMGGLGSRGTGPGGGGNSLGIGGLGNGNGRGTGGLGNVDLGGRGRGERSVEAGKTIIAGGLSQEAIKRVLDRAQSQLRYCYEKELQRLPDLNGKVTVKFVIGGTGGVNEANVSLTTLSNTNAEECMLRVFRRLKFPAPSGGGVVDVSYPMIYKPLGD
jgi:pSer/pThr/pTyr-binding forkhead associated (FHA) protein